jgi:hypothetical protein
MSTDSPRGEIEFFEDFLYDAAADKPEYAVDTDPAVQIVAAGIGGVMRITGDAGQANVGGIGFGATHWSAHDNYLYLEARVKISALGTASERVFVGFTDVQEDTLSEMPFTGATTVVTAVADPDDAIGFFWEGDMTGDYWQPASQNTDVVVVGNATNALTAVERTHAAITADGWHTLGMMISDGAKFVEFSVDGKAVYTYNGTTAVVADVALYPVMVITEGTGAMNVDMDYIYIRAGRDN